MPSQTKNTALIYLLRALVQGHALLGDPTAKLFALSPGKDPYPAFESIRAQGPLVRSRMGMYVSASHEIATSLLRDPRYGVQPVGEMSPIDVVAHAKDGRKLINPLQVSFLVRNPPDHTRLRKLVGGWFTPRALREQTPRIERVVKDYLDRVDGKPTFDLVGDFAAQVPVQVIADLLGVPSSDHSSFARWGSALSGTIDGIGKLAELRALHRALADFEAFLDGLIEHRRRHPGTDIVSALVAHDDLAREDLIATTELLLVAGFETTVNLIGNAVLAVLGHPEVRERLVADPGYADNIVEETLRLDPPVQYAGRITREPVELMGSQLPTGTPVLLLLAAANRDPAVFADPHRFNPDRPDVREHLSFSSGIHYCLGAGLARIEAAAALRGLFGRFPDLCAAGPVRRRPSRALRGPIHLPVTTGAPRPPVDANVTHGSPMSPKGT
jgi:P450-derived glycosyltransferase activator